MTTEQEAFVSSAYQLAELLIVTCNQLGLDEEQTTVLLCASTGEALGRLLGPVEAVEQLRNTADRLERSLMARATH